MTPALAKKCQMAIDAIFPNNAYKVSCAYDEFMCHPANIIIVLDTNTVEWGSVAYEISPTASGYVVDNNKIADHREIRLPSTTQEYVLVAALLALMKSTELERE